MCFAIFSQHLENFIDGKNLSINEMVMLCTSLQGVPPLSQEHFKSVFMAQLLFSNYNKDMGSGHLVVAITF